MDGARKRTIKEKDDSLAAQRWLDEGSWLMKDFGRMKSWLDEVLAR